jgi:7-carboxy-7-deazaguanine synthase
LRCSWCDTPYALERKDIAELRSVDDVMADIENERCNLIMLTGGEPLEQTAALELIEKLCDRDYEVTIETNGQADISVVDRRAVLIMDLKCSGSAMHKKNNYSNLSYLKKSDEIKFVIADRNDYEYARNLCKEKELYDLVDTILFSPAFGLIKEQQLAEWIIEDKLPVRMQLQTHKYIWHPEERGV